MDNKGLDEDVPVDNQFNSTGDWTQWKCPDGSKPRLHVRVRCVNNVAYRMQMRNFEPFRVLVKSSASNEIGNGPNTDATVPPNGGVSPVTKMFFTSCGNVKSQDVFITIDSIAPA